MEKKKLYVNAVCDHSDLPLNLAGAFLLIVQRGEADPGIFVQRQFQITRRVIFGRWHSVGISLIYCIFPVDFFIIVGMMIQLAPFGIGLWRRILKLGTAYIAE